MNQEVPEMNVTTGEILWFIGLVLGLSWLQFIPPLLDGTMDIDLLDGLEIALNVVFMFSPVIAALLLVARRSTTQEMALFLRSRLQWRVSLGWYLVAIFFLPLLIGGALVVYTLQAGTAPVIDAQALLLVIQVFTIGIIANLSENYGWRGYLQEGLQSAHSALVATLAVGIVWGLWHAPVFLLGDSLQASVPYGWYLVMIVGLAVLFGWVYNETAGSVLLVTLMHCAFNASIGPVLFSLIATDGDVGTFIVLCATVVWIAVGVVLFRTESKTLTLQRPIPKR